MGMYDEYSFEDMARDRPTVHDPLSCPRCGGNSRTECAADYRYGSGSGETRKCLRCGHCFTYDDGCTG